MYVCHAVCWEPIGYTQRTHLRTNLPEGLENENYPFMNSGELAL